MLNLTKCLYKINYQSTIRSIGNLFVNKGLPTCAVPSVFSGRSFHLLTTAKQYQMPVSSATQLDFLKTSLPLVNQIAGFKVKGRLKRRCKDCYFMVRQERAYVICKTHPRHKQMAMKKDDDKTWILTDATQSKERAW